MLNSSRPQKRLKTQGGFSKLANPSSRAVAPSPPPPSQSSEAKVNKNSNGVSVPRNDPGRLKRKKTPGKVHTVAWNDDPKLLKERQELPIWNYKPQIQEALHQSDTLVLVGETGSGKSTQVPQFLAREPWCRRQDRTLKNEETGEKEAFNVGGMIAVTQPRRVAATTLAHRVAVESGIPLGKSAFGHVGYSVRFDYTMPKGATIKFLTEGMLLQELLRDPHLRQYSAVVVDEIHERSTDVDLISGFLRQIQSGDLAGRGGIPLKVVIMSATADVEKIRGFFSASESHNQASTADAISEPEVQDKSVRSLHILGRQYPVETIYSPEPVMVLEDGLVDTVLKIHTSEPLPGGILAFLTGQEEIESARRRIEEQAASLPSNVPKIKVFPLYGQLSMEAQHAAFSPVKEPFTRKVVLATNIAETSVTIQGVRFVVDSGKAKIKEHRPKLGFQSLLSKPISKSSALQRTGRAGREAPGKCYRLYTEEGFETLADDDLPEILRGDVLSAVLTMKACGIKDVATFPLMDRPDEDAIFNAIEDLTMFRAIDKKSDITETGLKLARFPIAAPFGTTLIAAAEPEFDCVLEVIDIIACVTSGEDIFHRLVTEEEKEEVGELRKGLIRREGDLLTYLTTMQQYAEEHADRIEWCRKRRINNRNMKMAMLIRKQLRHMCLREKLLDEKPPPDPQPYRPMEPERADALLKCFLRGFLKKTALLYPDMSYVTTFGNHNVAIHPASVIHGIKREAIMFLDHVYTQKSYAKKVSIVEAVWIQEGQQSAFEDE